MCFVQEYLCMIETDCEDLGVGTDLQCLILKSVCVRGLSFLFLHKKLISMRVLVCLVLNYVRMLFEWDIFLLLLSPHTFICLYYFPIIIDKKYLQIFRLAKMHAPNVTHAILSNGAFLICLL